MNVLFLIRRVVALSIFVLAVLGAFLGLFSLTFFALFLAVFMLMDYCLWENQNFPVQVAQ